MIVVSEQGTCPTAMLGMVVALAMTVGCGGSDDEPPPKPPEFAEPKIECADSQDPDVEGKIVTAVSVKVTDPDRDLSPPDGGLRGTFDSLPIALTDEDADRRFSWQPSETENRIRCSGEHHLVVDAKDAKGNEATFDQRIGTNGDS